MIIKNDEEALRVQCSDVLEEEIGPLKDQLERELKNAQGGIGLAAPQIGIAKNMAIVRIDDENSVDLVNCKISRGYDKRIFESEGCLSFPGRYEKTLRFQEVHIVDNAVYPYSFISQGLISVVCQHELDHLSGVLLPDVALPGEKPKKLRPNDICSCGSGLKYKKCCKR